MKPPATPTPVVKKAPYFITTDFQSELHGISLTIVQNLQQTSFVPLLSEVLAQMLITVPELSYLPLDSSDLGTLLDSCPVFFESCLSGMILDRHLLLTSVHRICCIQRILPYLDPEDKLLPGRPASNLLMTRDINTGNSCNKKFNFSVSNEWLSPTYHSHQIHIF